MASAPATELVIQAASVTGPQLRVQHLELRLRGKSPQDLHWHLHSGVLHGTAAALHWQALQARGKLQAEQHRDALALDIAVQGSGLGNLQLTGRGEIGASDGQLRWHAAGKELGSWQGWWQRTGSSGWSAQAQGRGSATALMQQLLPATWHPQGTFRVLLDAQGQGWRDLDAAQLHAQFDKLQFSSPSGLQAAENGGLLLTLHLERSAQIWHGDSELRWQHGAVLWSPWYWAAPAGGVTLSGHGQYRQQNWQIQAAKMRWPGMGWARLSAQWRGARQGPNIHLQQADLTLGPVWKTWLRPLLPSSGLAHRLEAQGQLQLSGRYAGGLTAIRWYLRDGGLHDPNGQFALRDITSQGAWQRQGGESRATLQWLYGRFYDIPFGPLDAQFLLRAHGAELERPALVSVLGGRLRIEHLRANWQSGSPRFVLGGGVDHIQLGSLTHTFGWPHFGGTLDAEIPQLRYHQGDLETNSILHARAFGGSMAIDGLSLRGLFTPSPLLHTSIRLHNLQLKPLTDVFPVGYISGVLDGSVRDLTLLNWQPVAFTARVETHREPTVSQEISAAAIEKLTKLGGGGVSSFFQNFFLQFFRKFSYAKLGLGVKLQDGVATLSGVAEAEDGGFYLLQGQGLPRVNIIGYNRQSNWQELLSRLRAVMEGKAQVATGD